MDRKYHQFQKNSYSCDTASDNFLLSEVKGGVHGNDIVKKVDERRRDKTELYYASLNCPWMANKITMETSVKFSEGKINIRGNIVARETPMKADYVLYINSNNPIAIVEAKDKNHTVAFDLQQVMTYAKMLDL